MTPEIFKIALPDNETIIVEIDDTFTRRGRLWCVHNFGDTCSVSDYLTGRKIESVSGTFAEEMAVASAQMFIDSISEEKWQKTFAKLAVINEPIAIEN